MIIVNRDALSDALALVNFTSNDIHDVLELKRCENALRVHAGVGLMYERRVALVDADADEDFSCCVSARNLYALMKALPCEYVQLSLHRPSNSADQLRVECDSLKASFALYDPGIMPELAIESAQHYCALNASELKPALAYVLRIARRDDVVLFDMRDANVLHVVITDRKRLHSCDIDCELMAQGHLVITARTAHLIMRMFHDDDRVSISANDGMILFESSASSIYAPRTSLDFPLHYRRLIEGSFAHRCIIDSVSFAEALKRARAIFSRDEYESCTLWFSPSGLNLHARSGSAEYSESLICECDAELKIDFKPQYLYEAVSHVGVKVELAMNDLNEALRIKGEGLVSLVMPLGQ